MSDSTVSVIIPAYRAAHTVGRAVESVLSQSHPAREILVIDDGGDLSASGLLNMYGGHVRLLTQPHGGAARARNLGLDHATGSLIAFLDADDYWERDKLAAHVSLYARHSGLGLTCSRYYRQHPGHTRWLEPADSTIEFDTVLMLSGSRAFHMATKVWTGTVVVPRRVVGEQRFMPGLEPAEDRHLWMRLVSADPMWFSSLSLATAVLEPNSLSRGDSDRDCSNMLRVVREFSWALGPRETRRWEAYVYRRWAAARLGTGRHHDAWRPALQRWRRDLGKAEAWWIAAKSASRALLAKPRNAKIPLHSK